MAKRAAAAPKKKRSASPPTKPLEYNILLTATLCLLAAGAVMVYSSSSALTVLKDNGSGTGYLVKYVIYAAIGLAVMVVLSRRSLDTLARWSGSPSSASWRSGSRGSA
jgi:cell division protein FtsW (lipid II flippase)